MTLSSANPKFVQPHLNLVNKGVRIQKLTVLRAPAKKAEELWHVEFWRCPRPSRRVDLDTGPMCIGETAEKPLHDIGPFPCREIHRFRYSHRRISSPSRGVHT